MPTKFDKLDGHFKHLQTLSEEGYRLTLMGLGMKDTSILLGDLLHHVQDIQKLVALIEKTIIE